MMEKIVIPEQDSLLNSVVSVFAKIRLQIWPQALDYSSQFEVTKRYKQICKPLFKTEILYVIII